jgi:hypothetical protein
MMASEDKNIKANSAPENEAPPEKKSTSGTEPSKADGGELAVAFRFETPASRETRRRRCAQVDQKNSFVPAIVNLALQPHMQITKLITR